MPTNMMMKRIHSRNFLLLTCFLILVASTDAFQQRASVALPLYKKHCQFPQQRRPLIVLTTLADASTTSTITAETHDFLPLQQLSLPLVGVASDGANIAAVQASSSSPSLATEMLGEAMGTFWIVGVGSMASMAATFVDPFTTLPEIALVWSTAVTSAIFVISSVLKWSGAHFNPAITVANAMFRNFDWNKVIPYSLAQIVGATLGSLASYAVYANAIATYETNQGFVRASCMETARVFGEYFQGTVTSAQAFGVEALGTAILTATAFWMTHPSSSSSSSSSRQQDKQRHRLPVPAVMGATVFGLINALAPLTQAGMNPARDFGPRLVAYCAGWTHVAFVGSWVYILAPLVGAMAGAAWIDKVVFGATTLTTPPTTTAASITRQQGAVL